MSRRALPEERITRKLTTRWGDVSINAPVSTDPEELATLLDALPPSTPLGQVEGALQRRRARFAPWKDGEPGHSGLWEGAPAPLGAFEKGQRRERQKAVHLFQDRLSSVSQRSPQARRFEAVALEAGSDAEAELLAVRDAYERTRTRAIRAERLGIGAGFVGFAGAALALFSVVKGK